MYLEVHAKLPLIPSSDLVVHSSVGFAKRVSVDIQNDLVKTWMRRSIQLNAGLEADAVVGICSLAKPGAAVKSDLFGKRAEAIGHAVNVSSDGILTVNCSVIKAALPIKKSGNAYSAVEVVHAVVDLIIGDEPLQLVVPIILIN